MAKNWDTAKGLARAAAVVLARALGTVPTAIAVAVAVAATVAVALALALVLNSPHGIEEEVLLDEVPAKAVIIYVD